MFKAKIRVFLKKAYLMLLQYLSEKCTEMFPENVSRLLEYLFFQDKNQCTLLTFECLHKACNFTK